MAKIVCPECGKDDMIQKVSAIYSGGVSTTNYQQPVAVQTDGGMIYGNLNKTAVSHTDLARKLTPPSAPESPQSGNGGLWLFMVGVLIGGGIDCALAGGDNLKMMACFTFIIPALFGFLWYKFYYTPSQKVYREDLKPDYDRAMQKWSGLYYCYRNDCVFDPTTGESVPPERIRTLLY